MSKFTPCGGCGATTPSERCIGCLHDFGGGSWDTSKVLAPAEETDLKIAIMKAEHAAELIREEEYGFARGLAADKDDRDKMRTALEWYALRALSVADALLRKDEKAVVELIKAIGLDAGMTAEPFLKGYKDGW